MTIRELEQLLRSKKDAPQFGGDFSDARMDRVWTKIAADIGMTEARRPVSLGWKDAVDYFSWQMSRVWLRPMSVGFSVFALIFGGWIATVNASFDSVPGDVLYPVKLVTERVQVTLATSGEQRAKLHAEFAGRRLDELNAITSSDVEGKDTRYQAAVDGFKQEIASVNAELASIDPEQSAELAILVDQKTDEYEAAFVQSKSDVPENSRGNVAEALTAVEDTNAQALSAIVQSHETNRQSQTEESLQKNFQEKLKEFETRVALSLGRIAVIENLIGDGDQRTRDARDAVNSHDAQIQKAMDTFAAGGFRTAFDLLAGVEAEIARSEEIITELEIELTAGM